MFYAVQTKQSKSHMISTQYNAIMNIKLNWPFYTTIIGLLHHEAVKY